MHIIAGSLRGRRLEYVSTPELRPASQKVRSSVFNILRDRVDGARVLDLFCGTGSVGLEALSRGAKHVDFVDLDVGLVARNVGSLGVGADVDIYRKDAARAVRIIKTKGKSYDVIFVGAPYGFDGTATVLEEIGSGPVLAEGGALLYEHRNRTVPAEQYGNLSRLKTYTYGQTVLTLYERSPTPSP